MERWAKKIAVVTGCSSGIGKSIARHLCEKGMIVIGLARRVEHLKQLQREIRENNGEFYYYECNVACKRSVSDAFLWIHEKYQNVNLLVNNAGINISTSILSDGNEDILDKVINTNLMGSLYCTKQVYKLMQKPHESYYIIFINSILGHNVFRSLKDAKINVYPSSKFGLRAASEVLRLELLNDKRFHISSISPGLVKTEITAAHPEAESFFAEQPTLDPNDIARTVEFILSMDDRVQISDIIIRPVGEKL